MAKCIIHIGMHKTGSTSIQQSLHLFSDDQFFYARMGSVSNHSLALYSLFAHHPEGHHLHKAQRRDGEQVKKYNAAMRKDLERAIATASERTMLISGEDIGVLSESELRKLHNYFSKRCTQVLIVGYVRPPAALISSAFQQRVKGGTVGQLDLSKEYRNYEKSFTKFDVVFGRENVMLWKFATDTFPGGCVVQDFCNRLEIDLPVERIVRVNESLPKSVVCCLYTYNKFSQNLDFEKMTGPESQRLGEALADAADKKFRFSPDIIKPILEENKNDIEWMENRLEQTMAEDLGAHRPGDILIEEDLLTPDEHLVDKMLALLAGFAPANLNGATPQEVALLLHALRKKLGSDRMSARQGKRINVKKREQKNVGKGKEKKEVLKSQSKDRIEITDVIEQINQANPSLIASFPEGKAEALLQKVFERISSILSTRDEGFVRVVSLGQFRIKKVEQGAGSGKIARSKIFFRMAERSNETEKNATNSSGQAGGE